MNWENKIVIVAGADSLIGYALCQLLVKEHAIVYACGQSEQKLKLLDNIQTQVISLENIFSLKEWIDDIGTTHGHIDSIFCDTTAELSSVNVRDITPDIINKSLLATTYYSWKSALYAIPFLKESAHGSTVFITTNNHKHISTDNVLAALCSTSVESITKNFSSEVAASGIRMCSVAADKGACDMHVASCAAFLASPNASYITGTMMEVTN